MSKKKILTSILAVVLVLAVSVCCFVGCEDNKDEDKKPADDVASTPTEGDELEVETVVAGSNTFSIKPMAASSTGIDYLYRPVTVEFTGGMPSITKLNWSFAWADPAAHVGDSIDRHLELHEDSMNTNCYEIRCYAGFDGEAILTATTLDGQYSASATIVYRGAPESVTLYNSVHSLAYSSEWDKELYVINSGDTTIFNIVLDNTLHDVRVDFTPATINAIAYGGVIFNVTEYDADGGIVAERTVNCDIELTDWYENNCVKGYLYPFVDTDGSNTAVQLFNAYYEDNTLMVDTETIFGQTVEYELSEGGKLTCTPVGFVDGKAPYVDLQVVEAVNGMAETVGVQFSAPYQGAFRFTDDYIYF